MLAPRPLDDEARVAALHDLGVLDAPPQDDLDAVVRLAAYICGTPVAAINLVDRDRQWMAAAAGMDRIEVPRDDAICPHAMLDPGVTHLPDARLDERFADNPHVLEGLRLYASAPLITSDGHPLGSLCVLDDEVRELTDAQLAALQDLADQTMALFRMRRQAQDLFEAAQRMEHLATHDGLTGLPNRTLFADRLASAQARARRGDGAPPAVVFIDLDGFKRINDELGHAIGDRILVEAAVRLRAVLRDSDTLARLGGDEFVAVCEGIEEAAVGPLVDRLRQALCGEPVATDRGSVAIRASIGVACATNDCSPDDVVRRADAAMYVEKAARAAA